MDDNRGPFVYFYLSTFTMSNPSSYKIWENLLPEPQDKWLIEYFKLPIEKANDTMVAIMDIVDHNVATRLFVDGKQVEPTQIPQEKLDSALRKRDSRANTRIVLFVHDGREGLDLNMLSTLRQVLHVDPMFVMSHFFWDLKNRLHLQTMNRYHYYLRTNIYCWTIIARNLERLYSAI